MILVFDGNNLLHRSMHATGLSNLRSDDGKLTGGLYGSLKSIRSLLADFKPGECYVVFDGGVCSRRRELLPEYRGYRYRKSSDPLFEEVDEEKKQYLEDFHQQKRLLKFVLKQLGVRVCQVSGWEADDIIHLLVDYFVHEVEDETIYIISDDRDLVQLVGDGVSVYRPLADEVISDDNFELELGCRSIPEFLVKRAIVGEGGSDNIPGVPGVGKKTAEQLFIEFGDQECLYPFIDLLAFCEAHKTKRVRSIAANSDIVLRNYQIVCFDFVSADEDAMKQVVGCTDGRASTDLLAVKRMFTKLDLFSVLKEFHEWIIPFQRLS